MDLTLYQASVPPLRRALTNLIHLLEKALAHARVQGFDSTVLLTSRLYPDMFPLARQVQIASDVARRGVARLAGLEAPPMADNEESLEALIERLRESIAYLDGFSAEQIDGGEERPITVPIGKGETITMAGWPFLSAFVLPNVYFHTTTTYAILRHNGVVIGKRDFLGAP
ncbi:MAG: DUF1993 domain-containing protein [Cyanobium sp.]|uniref:DUF1993 domain-containing protein n=1 Tax=Synechococcus sp. CS-1333 TaxID=2848638 RepID=UPI000DBBE100|nr:DUF1993 domain-containing protein [Synechococcus sp. CS-1333]MCT0209921.1 DUF1993 domain-containing protein [Synechococcus sp. CS-1333]PZV22851.1 MAG: DUF1993 domain-containing protein [Cyanobium sp.]